MTAASWQDRILREFLPGASPITLAADPDGLPEAYLPLIGSRPLRLRSARRARGGARRRPP